MVWLQLSENGDLNLWDRRSDLDDDPNNILVQSLNLDTIVTYTETSEPTEFILRGTHDSSTELKFDTEDDKEEWERWLKSLNPNSEESFVH